MRARTGGAILLGGIIIFSIIFLTQPTREPNAPAEAVFLQDAAPKVDTTPFGRSLSAFDIFLRTYLDSLNTVGAAATVFHNGEVAYTLTYGLRKAGTHDSVNRNTVFRLASVSKGFAGVLSLKLQQKGSLKLENKVKSYLPNFMLKDSLSTQDLAIYHLLNHTSGLVPHAYDNLAEEGQTVADILPRLVEVDIAGPPGMYYGYQNVMFSLMDTIARLSTGKNYPVLMSENIFSPLGMDNASASYVDLVWNKNVAFPHYKRSREFHPLPLHTGYYNLLPAAGINASIEDMGKWLGGLLGYFPGGLDQEILDSLASPQIKTPLKRAYTRRWDRLDGRYYSFGWRIFDYKGKRIIYHGGYVRGYRAEIAFCPELDVGIAFLQNSPNGVASRFVPTFFNLLLARI